MGACKGLDPLAEAPGRLQAAWTGIPVMHWGWHLPTPIKGGAAPVIKHTVHSFPAAHTWQQGLSLPLSGTM